MQLKTGFFTVFNALLWLKESHASANAPGCRWAAEKKILQAIRPCAEKRSGLNVHEAKKDVAKSQCDICITFNVHVHNRFHFVLCFNHS